ncbi:MAG: hypothetical protein IJ569_03070 [Prevotella sp.]|nr:hypothetical protein [Prevotella sp.]
MSENPSGQGGEIARWFVLTHLEPEQIEAQLQLEQTARRSYGTPFQFFIPFRAIKRRVTRETFSDADPLSDYENPRSHSAVYANNQLRRELHDYVFVRSDLSTVRYLVREASWNVGARIRLQFYRDPLNEYATVRSDRMSAFIQACSDQAESFEVVPVPQALKLHDHVIINVGSFRGQTAEVLGIRHTPRGVLLEVGFELIPGQEMVRKKGLSRRDVLPMPNLSPALSRLLKPGVNPIDDAQQSILDILRRRVGRTATTEQVRADRKRLRELASYDRLTVETPAARNHLLALLLVCATLRRDRDAMQRLSETCLSQLELLSETRLTDVHCYLWIALFVATRNPQYRDLAKHYVQRYNPRSARLREFVTLIRRRTAL